MSMGWLLSLVCVALFISSASAAVNDEDLGQWGETVGSEPQPSKFMYTITSHKDDAEVKKTNENAVKIADKEITTQFGKIRMHLYGDVEDLCPKEPGKSFESEESPDSPPENKKCEPRYAVITINQEGILADAEISTNRAGSEKCDCEELKHKIRELEQRLEVKREAGDIEKRKGKIILVPGSAPDDVKGRLRDELARQYPSYCDLGKYLEQHENKFIADEQLRTFAWKHGGLATREHDFTTQLFCEFSQDGKKYVRFVWAHKPGITDDKEVFPRETDQCEQGFKEGGPGIFAVDDKWNHIFTNCEVKV